jgi:hypothetical protein
MTLRNVRPVRPAFRTHKSAEVTLTVRAGSKRQQRRFPVTVTRPDQRVWKAALQLARGDASRLRVIDTQTVIVLNRGRAAL